MIIMIPTRTIFVSQIKDIQLGLSGEDTTIVVTTLDDEKVVIYQNKSEQDVFEKFYQVNQYLAKQEPLCITSGGYFVKFV